MKKTAPDTIEARIHAAENRARVQQFDYPLVAENPGMAIEEYVRYTMKAYEDAWAECGDLAVAAMAWRHCLPILDSTNAAKAFIACVAVGQARGWVDANDSRALMYTAQLALAAMKGGK